MKARENPFSADRVEKIRFMPEEWDWPSLMEKLRRLHYRAAIVGQKGSGKTVLLEDVAERLKAAGMRTACVQFRENEPRRAIMAFPYILFCKGGTILLIDGAEQLDRLSWALIKVFSLRLGGLVITSHMEGRLPLLTKNNSGLSTFKEIVRRLAPALPEDSMEKAFHTAGGNMRQALRALYDAASVES